MDLCHFVIWFQFIFHLSSFVFKIFQRLEKHREWKTQNLFLLDLAAELKNYKFFQDQCRGKVKKYIRLVSTWFIAIKNIWLLRNSPIYAISVVMFCLYTRKVFCVVFLSPILPIIGEPRQMCLYLAQTLPDDQKYK